MDEKIYIIEFKFNFNIYIYIYNTHRLFYKPTHNSENSSKLVCLEKFVYALLFALI